MSVLSTLAIIPPEEIPQIKMVENAFTEFFTSVKVLTVDMKVYQFAEMLQQKAGRILDPLLVFFTHLGDDGYFFIALAIVLLLFKKTRKAGIACILGLGAAACVNNLVIKELVQRPRPYIMDYWHPEYWARVATAGWKYDMPFKNLLEGSTSFASGHTASAFGAAMGIFYADKKKGIPALIVAAIIGFSRIYIHVHYPTDVFAGVIVGVVMAVFACAIFFAIFGRPLDKLNAKTNYKIFPENVKLSKKTAAAAAGANADAPAEETSEETAEETVEEAAEEAEKAAEETQE